MPLDEEQFLEAYRARSYWIALWAGVWLGGAIATLFEAESVVARALAWTVVAGSFASVVLYGIDKFAAVGKKRRLHEIALHVTALLGGWPGAAIGQRLFRHKTRKASFLLKFLATAAAHSLFCVAAYVALAMVS